MRKKSTLRKKIVAFDIDDTLAPSKTSLSKEMAEAILRISSKVQVAIISGGAFPQFKTQIIAEMNKLEGNKNLANFHLLPTCGTQYWRYIDGQWSQLYSHLLPHKQAEFVIMTVRAQAKKLGFWCECPWGEIIENRGSQITFSALGQQAPLEEKRIWDPDGTKKEILRQAVADCLRGEKIEVKCGGSTSIDITQADIDKAYGMKKLSEETKIEITQMLFIGDRLDVGGNDYPVKALGVDCLKTSNPSQTLEIINKIMEKI